MSPISLMVPQLPTLKELTPYLEEIDRERLYTNFGPLLCRFEALMGERLGLSKEQVATAANATLALSLALEATDCQRGTLCIVPSYTFSASAAAIVRAGLIPFFVDVDRDTLGLTPEIALDALEQAPAPVGVVMPVSPFGRPVDSDAWERFQAQTGLPVVIDAAASFDGASKSSVPSVISLHATKVFGVGEGALIFCSDAGLIERFRELTSFGFPFHVESGTRSREPRVAGTNGKLSEYAAAVGLAMWDRWPSHRAQLEAVRSRYLKALANLPGMSPQPGDDGTWVSATLNVLVGAELLEPFLARLDQEEIPYRRWWQLGCHEAQPYSHYPCTALPITEDLALRVIGLPCSPDLSPADQDRVIAAMGGHGPVGSGSGSQP